jgi:hypothetical protein
MTVAELIFQLRQFPPDMPVYVEGDETGHFPVIAVFVTEAVVLKTGERDQDID